MKLLSFLGTGKYETTCYAYAGEEYTGRLSIAASCRFLKADTVILFLTEEAHQQHIELLREEIPPGVEMVTRPVPHGHNETELWAVFQEVSGSVSPGEEVAFDITNGLRSFPLVGLLVAAFLRSGLEVNLKAVLYGAFDVRDRSVTPNRTAMFDLSPMLALLEWSSAAERFNRTGDARYLAGLIREQKNRLAVEAGGDRELISQAGALGSLATGLTDISQAIHLIRPSLALGICADLPRRMENARPALNRATAAMPFDLVLGEVANRFTPLGLANPLLEENLPEMLAKQRLMIQRYADWELWVQAVTLAREWLVSWFMVRGGMTDIVSAAARKDMEFRINGEARELIQAQKRGLPFPPLAAHPAGQEGLTLWSMVIDTRNDIDHAGMRKKPGEPKTFIALIEKVIERINQLELPEVP